MIGITMTLAVFCAYGGCRIVQKWRDSGMLVVLTLLALQATGSAQVNNIAYYIDATTYSGYGKVTSGTVRFIIPPGLPDGDYSFKSSTSSGSEYFWFRVYLGIPRLYGATSGAATYQFDLTGINANGVNAPTPAPSTNTATQNIYVNTPSATNTLIGNYTRTGNNVIQASPPYDTTAVNLGVFATFTMPGGTANVLKILHVDVSATGKKAHTIQLKRGSDVIGSVNITASGTAQTGAIDVETGYNVPGETYSLVVDGGVLDTEVNGVLAEGVLVQPYKNWEVNLQDEGTIPNPEVATGTQGNAGNSTTTVSTGTGSGATTTTSTKVNNGNTTISGNATGATVQDLYNAMKTANGETKLTTAEIAAGVRAGDNAAAQDSIGSVGTFSYTPEAIPNMNTDGVTGIKDTVEGHLDEMSSSSAGFITGVDTLTGMDVPTGIGKTWGFNMTLPMLGAVNLSWASYETQITVFRMIALACMTMLFWFWNIKIAKGALD